eukprot:290412_1
MALSVSLLLTTITYVSFSYGALYEYNGSTNATSNRRRLANVINFNGPNVFLNGVAAISWNTHLTTTFCTGAYIQPPRGFNPPTADTYYVLTAAHCVYSRNQYPNAGNGWTDDVWEAVGGLRVEFGLTGSSAPGSAGITTCTVDDYRIYNKYAMAVVDRRCDYAVIQMTCLVAPTNPFTIRNFVNQRVKDQEFGRAGYRGTRVLSIEEHYRVRGSDHKRNNAKNTKGVMVSRGISHGGDSGGPVYDASNPHYLRAVHSGTFYGTKKAIKITKDVHKITNFFNTFIHI